MKKLALLALTTALAGAGSAQGAIVYLSTDGSQTSGGVATQPTANPALTLVEGETATLYVLGKRSGASGSVNGLGLSIAQTGTGSVSATGFNILNPVGENLDGETIRRWQGTPVNGTLNAAGGYLVKDSFAAAVSDPAGFFQSLNQNLRVHGILTIKAETAGVINLFLEVGEDRISESNNSPTSFFGLTATGTDDGTVLNATAGARTQLADAVITVVPVPEPAAMSLLGLGAAGLLARRRRA